MENPLCAQRADNVHLSASSALACGAVLGCMTGLLSTEPNPTQQRSLPLVNLFMEGLQDGDLGLDGDGHIVFHGVQSPQDEVEDANSIT